MEELLTVPGPVEPAAHLPTGNHVLAIPGLRVRDAAIDSLNVVLARHRGLVGLETAGGPPASAAPATGAAPLEALLRPGVEVEGRAFPLELDETHWLRLGGWWPHFALEREGWQLEGTLCCPPTENGLIYLLRLTRPPAAGGPPRVPVWLGVEGSWGRVYYAALRPRPVEASLHLSRDPWTGSLVVEVRAGLPLFALAVAATHMEVSRWDQEGWRVGRSFELEPGESAQFTAFVAVAPEGDGAAVTAMHLRRRDVPDLLRESTDWVTARRLRLPQLPDLEGVMARNQFFNCFFALGRALDTGTLVPLTSRSPRYYVCGAFWARDALLWSFPALLLTDRHLAREALLSAWELCGCAPGEHALYPDGRVLYPGFELDQACAPIIALAAYLSATRDVSVLEEPQVDLTWERLEWVILAQRHPRVALYSTFLDPADDPVRHPYLTYNNALVWQALLILAALHTGLEEKGRAAKLRGQAAAIKGAVRRHCVVEGPFGPMYAWSVDPDNPGSEELYDVPAGSLELLPWTGFCSRQDPVYRNTVSWIYSPHNPFFTAAAGDGREERGAPGAPTFRGPGCRHAPATWPLSAVNCLLGGADRARVLAARDFFLQAEMDTGLFCETVDPATGVVRTGAAFASGAGFMTVALRSSAAQEKSEAAASWRGAAPRRVAPRGPGGSPPSGGPRPGKGRKTPPGK